ncbi:unnamed protein product [Durusdinium trenchii]|uniref:inositol-phosphate phosphatase n=1 Tax=Durusdinium trenchii TaxID=1381693 RepID=A0ABP0ME58_9DINO
MADLDESNLRRYLDEAVSAAHEAGNLMLECFARNDAHTSVEEKASNADLVTKYDRQVEELVLTRLRACAPDFGVVAEETASKEELTDAPTWVVDPIDGTTNFIHRQAECCVLIGLAVRKRAVLGVCFIPKMDELYTAIKGHGAFCNGRRIASSGCKDLTKAMVNLHFPSYSRGPKVLERILGVNHDLLAHPVRAIRSGGSAGVDMMHVARGRLDAYFEVGIYPWDVCAGQIIVEEAGGKFWVNQPGQLSFEIQFNRGDRVRDLRTVIEKVTGIPPEAQELRANGEMVDKEGQFLEAMDLSDIWVMDDRDDSPERGEWNPDPEEAGSRFHLPRIGTYIFSAILTIFWVTQVAGVNPYGNWPEGPRLDWSQVPEDLRPGNTPIQRPQALTVEPEQEKKMIEQRNKLPAA